MTAPSGAPARVGRGLRVWYRIARTVCVVFSRTFWRVRVTGLDHVPRSGAYVIAPVHRSVVDSPLCGNLTARRLRFMAKDSIWRWRWSGAFVESLGGFPVHRGSADREALRVCEEALRAGDPVVLFPEGTRQEGPLVQPLLEGAVFVAARAGVPIVPVGIGGSDRAMPKGSRGIRPVRIAMVVGAPIVPPARAEGRRLPRRVVAEMTETLHTELQRLYDEARAAAGA